MLLGTPAADCVSQSNPEAGERRVLKTRLERDIAATAVIVHGKPASDFVKKLLEIGFGEIIVAHDGGAMLTIGDQRVHQLSFGEGFRDRAAGLNVALEFIEDDFRAKDIRFILMLSSKVVLDEIRWATVFSWNHLPGVMAIGATLQASEGEIYEFSNDFALYRREAFNRHSLSRFPSEEKEAIAWKAQFESLQYGKVYEHYFQVRIAQ